MPTKKQAQKEQENDTGNSNSEYTSGPDEIEQLMEAWLKKYAPAEEYEQEEKRPKTATSTKQQTQGQKSKEGGVGKTSTGGTKAEAETTKESIGKQP